MTGTHPNFILLGATLPDVAQLVTAICKLAMQSNVDRGHTRKSPLAKNGGPTCSRTRALASESGAPISQSSKRSIGSPTNGARSYLSRAASAIGGLRFRA